MIDFAVIALPRSGTAWAANFLTTDQSLCLHDPLADMPLDELKQHAGGISCTAIWMHPEFVYDNIKRWVILERDISEVNQYALDVGYPPINESAINMFRQLRGPRMSYKSLFAESSARDIFEYLLPEHKFDASRHKLLASLTIEARACYVQS